MEIQFTYVAPPSRCGYLPDQQWSLEYEFAVEITAAEYLERMRAGWRHFGRMLFRPRCPGCTACRSLRVLAREFQPDRSQRRTRRANEGDVRLVIGKPSVTRAKLDLYDRYHAFQSEFKGWPMHGVKDSDSYTDSFVDNPFSVQEWCYYLGRRLIGIGYVDDLPGAFSAVYFFYDPEFRDRSLGTWNILSLIDVAARQGREHVYLGYHVAGCRSMEYKGRFHPSEIRHADGEWRPLEPESNP
jgi:leucyl-tRNA---protein transferase